MTLVIGQAIDRGFVNREIENEDGDVIGTVTWNADRTGFVAATLDGAHRAEHGIRWGAVELLRIELSA